MLFTHELTRRGMRAYATDPGATDTDIIRNGSRVMLWLAERKFPRYFVHSPAQGARATIQAVTADLPSGTYLAPRFNQLGKPKVTRMNAKARDPAMSRRLWELSAELTGCDWP